MMHDSARAAGVSAAARVFFCAALLVTCVLGVAAANADGPPLAHTGGFGEKTCRDCHTDYDLNEPGGGITLDGLPEAYEAGRIYRFTVSIRHPELQRAGFELAFRFAAGAAAGRQAGEVRTTDERARVSRDTTGILYAHHVDRGVDPVEQGLGRWTLEWMAPAAGTVVLHIAANASDNNDSPLGDRIYTTERRLKN
jgi:hypothetical protein